MNICIINGSPKGKNSITYQTLRFLEIKFPEHVFTVLHASQQINGLEKDFSKAVTMMQQADVLIFSYPVYTFIAPSQLHRFIELLKKENVDLSNKYVTQITTSKHFYDVTAHKYIQENVQDLGMKYIKGLSADMDDLLKKEGQKEAEEFFKYVLWNVQNDYYESFPPVLEKTQRKQVSIPSKEGIKRHGDVVIVTDLKEEDEQLQTMIARFQNVLPLQSRVINLRELRIDGGCLGCFNCAVNGSCIYKDKFDDYLRNEIQAGQAIVYAFTISNHSMGSLFKKYDDRNFCNGHRTVTMGMPFGYLISGNYAQEANLQMILEGRAEVGHNFLAGIATDEINPDLEIDKLAKSLVYAIDHQYVLPQNFYGVGGMKIFRDLIYKMQGMMKADHKFYKEHGQYDFPQKDKKTLIGMYIVGALISNEKIKSKMGNKMTEGMLMPYDKLFKKIRKQEKKKKK